MPRSVEFTRQQLYDLVWARPMPKVAASFPMSPITLKKICLKHHVPVPPVGYWSKPEVTRIKPPLPEPTVGDHRIWVRRFLQRNTARPPLVTGQPDKEHWHECTRRTEGALKQSRPDNRGALIATGVGTATVNVAPETVDRSLAVLDSLIKAVLKLGHSVPSHSSPAAFFVQGAHVPFAVIERFVRNDGSADVTDTAWRDSYALHYPSFAKITELKGWPWRPTGHRDDRREGRAGLAT